MYMDIGWIIDIDPDTGEVIMGGGRYTDLKNLSFAPQTDLTGTSMPVNEYTVDVITTDDIPVEVTTCELRDDRNFLWAAYPIRKVVRISENCLRLTCTSWLHRLQYRDMPETVYTGETAATVISAIFYPDANIYQLNASLRNVQIYGYAPAQTARDRLTWLLLVLRAHVVDIYRDTVAIKLTDETVSIVPLERTYMRPSVDKTEWVTGIEITAYTFSQAASREAWEADDSHTRYPYPWISTERTFSVTNPNAPDGAPENVKKIDGIYLANDNNATNILTNLAKYWFGSLDATADFINNRLYAVGNLICVYTGEDSMISGYVQQLSFKFGHQSMSTAKLIGCNHADVAALTVDYMCDETRLKREKYYLPVGVSFSIENKYMDIISGGHRRIYRPTTEAVTGIMVSEGMTVSVEYELYLDYYRGVLHVIGVDEITTEQVEGNTIGVIA